MEFFWIGVAFLILVGFVHPVLRRVAHGRMLRNLDMDGVTVMPTFLGYGGLRVTRARWDGEVSFTGPSLGGGGRTGHLELIASLRRPTPTLSLYEKGRRSDAGATEPVVPTGDADFDAAITVRGDAEFAKKLLVPGQRERLLLLKNAGGYLWAISGGVAELGGPLPQDGRTLKDFLELCDAFLHEAAGAVAS
jgi:hypothetical protein